MMDVKSPPAFSYAYQVTTQACLYLSYVMIIIISHRVHIWLC